MWCITGARDGETTKEDATVAPFVDCLPGAYTWIVSSAATH